MENLFMLHLTTMSKYQIKIDEPCHENWHAMSQKEQGRFCSVCAKDVVDFTAMSDQEVKSYFTNYKGSLCGRFNQNQLEVKDKLYFNLTPDLKKFIRAFATVFLLISASCTSAQTMGKPAIQGDVICETSFEITHKGVIYGEDGTGIGDVLINFSQQGVIKKRVTTSNDGTYSLTLKNGSYTVTIIKQGYETYQTEVAVSASGTVGDFELQKQTDKNIVEPKPLPTMGRISIMGAPRKIELKK